MKSLLKNQKDYFYAEYNRFHFFHNRFSKKIFLFLLFYHIYLFFVKRIQ